MAPDPLLPTPSGSCLPPSQGTWVWTLCQAPEWHLQADACTAYGEEGWKEGQDRGSSGPLGEWSLEMPDRPPLSPLADLPAR